MYPVSDKPREECGVFGIAVPHEEAARHTFFGIFALQHRGQEAAGIAVSNKKSLLIHKNKGLVSQVFNEGIIDSLSGGMAIGHTRYSTTGSNALDNIQPLHLDTLHGPLALAHNGNLVNARELRHELMVQGAGFTSTSDTQVMIMMLAAANGSSWLERISQVMPEWQGAYSVVILTNEGIFAARDPWGLRPLILGELPDGGYVVASESGALETIGAKTLREVLPGEVVEIHHDQVHAKQVVEPKADQAQCTFEYIYFSRPDSVWGGEVLHEVRRRLGMKLAEECPVDADVVVPVPDSSIPAGIGYAEASGIDFDIGLIKNRYIGRTFIQPSQEMRMKDVNMKFNPIPSVIEGKRVILIDDSIVRGTTMRHLIALLKGAGAKEVHVRITCPPIKHPCFMGVDMSDYAELIAHEKTVDEMADYFEADSLYFISEDGMVDAIGAEKSYCNACFNGRYPFELNTNLTKFCFEAGAVL